MDHAACKKNRDGHGGMVRDAEDREREEGEKNLTTYSSEHLITNALLRFNVGSLPVTFLKHKTVFVGTVDRNRVTLCPEEGCRLCDSPHISHRCPLEEVSDSVGSWEASGGVVAAHG